MNADQKAKLARVLGYICVTVGTLNLTLVAVQAARGQTDSGFSLLVTGISALLLGVIMLVRGKRKPTSEGS